MDRVGVVQNCATMWIRDSSDGLLPIWLALFEEISPVRCGRSYLILNGRLKDKTFHN